MSNMKNSKTVSIAGDEEVTACCGTCWFGEIGDPGEVFCHRHALRPKLTNEALDIHFVNWPSMDNEDWCGEWELDKV